MRLGTLIEAWASMKSFRPKDGSGEPPAPGSSWNREFADSPLEEAGFEPSVPRNPKRLGGGATSAS
jgi:hypothetical protein